MATACGLYIREEEEEEEDDDDEEVKTEAD
jgi:hypothetical protein